MSACRWPVTPPSNQSSNVRYKQMTNSSQYTSYLTDNQSEIQKGLDKLIVQYEGNPVGNGYIDIIVIRERYADFISSLTDNGLVVEAISWWCLASEENKESYGCPHGYGGPMTKFGWFSELSHDLDEIDDQFIEQLESEFTQNNIELINDNAKEIIKHKITMPYSRSKLEFQANSCLTPGIWIRVPQDWIREDGIESYERV